MKCNTIVNLQQMSRNRQKCRCNLLILNLQAMESSGKDRFLIDGFPRNQDNLDGWNKEMSDVATVIRVLFFNCPEQV